MQWPLPAPPILQPLPDGKNYSTMFVQVGMGARKGGWGRCVFGVERPWHVCAWRWGGYLYHTSYTFNTVRMSVLPVPQTGYGITVTQEKAPGKYRIKIAQASPYTFW